MATTKILRCAQDDNAFVTEYAFRVRSNIEFLIFCHPDRSVA